MVRMSGFVRGREIATRSCGWVRTATNGHRLTALDRDAPDHAPAPGQCNERDASRGSPRSPSASLRAGFRCAKNACSRMTIKLPLRAGSRLRQFCYGSTGEAREHSGKIEQSQAPQFERGGMSGATLGSVLAWEFLSGIQRSPESRFITFRTFVPFQPIADAGRMQSASGQREKRDQPTFGDARW